MSVGRRHPGDIPIGDGRWLPWTDLPDGVGGQAFDLDPLLEELAGFWDALETMCLRACCGLDAFDLRSDAIRAAARASGGAAVHSRLVAMRQWVVDAPAATSVTSSRLNLRLHRDLLLALVDHMITSVAACDNLRPPTDRTPSCKGKR